MGAYAFTVTIPLRGQQRSVHAPLSYSILIFTSSLTNFFPSFFANKGAVAGVFTVVGLIGLVLLIVLIINIVRRRRAQNFDKELIAATREAAATAPNPNFLDDEEDPEDRFKRGAYGMGYGSGGSGGYNGGGNGTGYSDVSHGTYGQAPMEAYNMRDLGGHGTGVGEIYDPYAAGGAAGIGVARARSMRVDPANASPNSYAAALQDGGAPYPKFAIGPHDTYGNGGGGASFGRGPNTNLELLEAAGMGNHLAGAGMISRGQQYQQGPSYQEYPSLGRNKSSSTGTSQPYQPSTSSTPPQSLSYSSYPQLPYPTRQLSPQQTLLAPSAYPSGSLSPGLPNPHAQGQTVEPSERARNAEDAEDAYGGYIVEDPTTYSTHGHGQPQAGGSKYIPNPFDRGSSSPEVEDRLYEKEEEERVEPKRVLKVCFCFSFSEKCPITDFIIIFIIIRLQMNEKCKDRKKKESQGTVTHGARHQSINVQ